MLPNVRLSRRSLPYRTGVHAGVPFADLLAALTIPGWSGS